MRARDTSTTAFPLRALQLWERFRTSHLEINKDAPDCLVRARLGPVRGGSTRAREAVGGGGSGERAGGDDCSETVATWNS